MYLNAIIGMSRLRDFHFGEAKDECDSGGILFFLTKYDIRKKASN